MSENSLVKAIVTVLGTVQGVGFRPFVYGLARDLNLSGFVRNDGGRVYIEVTGDRETVDKFLWRLKAEAPPLSRIEDVQVDLTIIGSGESWDLGQFVVAESRKALDQEPAIPPDSALCDDCRREMMNPGDRRYLYPFITCTNCGPRFTIVEGVPYDRALTSMADFPMCAACAREYSDPGDRRFHAEPDSCGECGPQVTVLSFIPLEAPETGADSRPAWARWACNVAESVRRGRIVAIKGIGGFHLACDAENDEAVLLLRSRKARPARPFAVMACHLDTVKKHFWVSPDEESVLKSPAAPIVILKKRPHCPLSELVAPGLDHIGIMLAYTPLHAALLAEKGINYLVMTSGNVSGLPLEFENRSASTNLRPIADLMVTHDRRIVRPCDDSVVRTFDGETLFYRRSRGYVPDAIEIPVVTSLRVLGAGGEGKNTFCMLGSGKARLSQHIGDMFNEENLERYVSVVNDLTRLYGFEPDLLAVDSHPGYQVTERVRHLFPQVPVLEVQHHHAHMAAAMASAGLTGKTAGLILDGTGYGQDGAVWGGELLVGDYAGYERRGFLEYVTMPGGEKAIQEPWRMAVAYLKKYAGKDGLQLALRLFPEIQSRIRILWEIADSPEFPATSSAGRLFDALSAILGLCRASTYDGQAAVLLGEKALLYWQDGGSQDVTREISLRPVSPDGSISTRDLILSAVEEALSGSGDLGVARAAFEFHAGFARLLTYHLTHIMGQAGVSQAVLSGGVFQNPLFLRLVVDYMREMGVTVYWPVRVPPNDGGLSLGQAAVAAARGG